MSARLSRRQFLRLGLGDLAGALRDNRGTTGRQHLRPPGALADEEAFLSTCQRCHRCVDACPFDVIHLLGPAAGPAESTPTLAPARGPCRWCTDLDCVRACPSGALSRDQDGHIRPIASATIDLERCLISQGILCDECATVCPSSVRAIRVLERRPRIDTDACVGCGLCAFFCPAEPVAVHIDAPNNIPTKTPNP